MLGCYVTYAHRITQYMVVDLSQVKPRRTGDCMVIQVESVKESRSKMM